MWKKLATVVAAVLVIVVIGGFWIAMHIPSSPFDGATETAAETPPAQSEYVARLADCVACHSLPDKPPFSGGLAMGTPMGLIFATNITPDKDTGIGNYTLAEFDNAVRRGVARDGHRLYPAMPYPSYAKLSDDDVKSLYAYFMHQVAPAHAPNQGSTIPFPLNMRWPLAFWDIVFTRPGTYVPNPAKDELWNRGAYLVQGPGHCGACHTPRGIAIEEKALSDSSAQYLSGGVLDGWYAPSLRGDPNSGLGRWSEADVAGFLKNGRNQHGIVFGSMADAYNNSTQFMSDQDLAAIAHYLKSLPGDPSPDGTPWQPEPAAALQTVSAEAAKPGQQIYLARCGFCHSPDGKGRQPWITPLAGATSVLAKDNMSAINIVLNGSGRVVTAGVPDAYHMPSLRDQLSDDEIADALTYVRSSWGNHADPVKPADVKALRDKTNSASPEPIVLQMR